jgi:hypothetical protein
VLAWEAQVGGELGQGVEHAGDRARVAGAPAGGERLGAAAGLDQGGLAWGLLDVVEDLPEGGLERVLVGCADLGEGVAGAMGLCRFKLVACWRPMRCRRR